ncbi:Z1 domain-containing protein [Dankookia sp. GCM10030260]|uniref:Z1 domain-containing protein n=1 Tax=Dankookia sp. GCM10030260 TaxID=3273390 RepID=UPI0036161AE2
MSDYYDRLSKTRADSPELADCIRNTVAQLNKVTTTSESPGILLGKIQSGKTRAFVGIIAAAFDDGFSSAIVLTKGTKSLSSQTVARLKKDFKDFIGDDEFAVFDIMRLPPKLTKNELSRKIIFVAKKQIHNLERLAELYENNPRLKGGKVLLVDDEADLAGVRFVKEKGTQTTVQGKIAQAIDDLRGNLKRLAVLQVTATPYSLYLQPEAYAPSNQGNFTFKPKRPAFTMLLPIHPAYVGGDDYFGSFEQDDPRSRLFVQVSDNELDALRREDKRRISEDRVLETDNTKGLRRAIISFVAAVSVRRWQQKAAGQKQTKYSMVIHNDTQRAAHDWQKKVINWIFGAVLEQAASAPRSLRTLFKDAYDDLAASVKGNGGVMPSEPDAFKAFIASLNNEDFTLENVNSDNDVAALLDENSELMLRTPGNIFVGGNILDRGITIPSLISFYYGRNPRVMQADTVLQHSRMYGSRPREDLAVTRFFTSNGVYDRLFKINTFENALREAFENGTHDRGVVFIQNDARRAVRPCAPNKILLSDVVAAGPGHLFLPTSFDTVRGAEAVKIQKTLDALVNKLCPLDGEFRTIKKADTHAIIDLIAETLEFDDVDFEWGAMKAMIDYYSKSGTSAGAVDLIRYSGRRLSRAASGDRTGISILGTPTVRTKVLTEKRTNPALVLLQQVGGHDLGWASTREFWWPILAPPPGSKPVVFASKVAA